MAGYPPRAPDEPFNGFRDYAQVQVVPTVSSYDRDIATAVAREDMARLEAQNPFQYRGEFRAPEPRAREMSFAEAMNVLDRLRVDRHVRDSYDIALIQATFVIGREIHSYFDRLSRVEALLDSPNASNAKIQELETRIQELESTIDLLNDRE